MDAIFTPAELEEIRAYVRPFHAWLAVRDVVHVAVFLLIARFAIRPLHRWSCATAEGLSRQLMGFSAWPVVRALPAVLGRLWGGAGWGAALLFALAYVVLLTVVDLPRSIYFGYLHEHRFGLSNYSPAGFAVDQLKGFILFAGAMALLAFGLYGLARRLGTKWWWVLGVPSALLLLASAALDPYRSQLYYEQAPLPAGALRDRVQALLDKAGIEYGEVRVEASSRASKSVNAYFAGQGPSRSIVLTDTLVAKLPAEEILAVIAHEAGHVREPIWGRRVLSSVALVAFLFLMDRLLRWAQRRRWFGATEFADIRTLPLLGFALYLLVSLGQPLSAWRSRQDELRADRYALELTKDPAAFRAMLVRVAKINKADPDPPAWVVWRGLSHPPLRERLDQVAAWESASDR